MVTRVPSPSEPLAVITGPGTAEADWAAWSPLAALPVLDLSGCRRAVVLAPHPDDETLGVGGLIAMLLAGGAQVLLVAVTDGEASHPGSPTVQPSDLRTWRTAETAAALAALGDGQPGELREVRLHLSDGGLAACEVAMAELLNDQLAPGDWCLAPFHGDGHPDHEAAGRAAARACAGSSARLLSYPVWAWHWARPGDPRVPWSRALRLPLPEQARRRKLAAIACFLSQIEPLSPAPQDAAIVGPADLAHFTRADEVVFA